MAPELVVEIAYALDEHLVRDVGCHYAAPQIGSVRHSGSSK